MDVFVDNSDEDKPAAGGGIPPGWGFLLAFFPSHFHLRQGSFLHHRQLSPQQHEESMILSFLD